jgi:dCTP deaminase
MPLLRRQNIEDLLRAALPLIENFDAALLGTNQSPVRGASLDLKIGRIFLPGVADGKLGGSDRGRRWVTLGSGETAVVRTAETLRLPGDIAAIGFPPSTAVSLAGLLTTNPGHVDPGYWGPLHLTVINMGKESFSLVEGDRIMRLMLFRLSAYEPASAAVTTSPINEELLAKLSPDFLNVSSRVDGSIEKAGWRIQSRNALIPVATGIISAILGGVAAFALNYYSGVQQMKVDIATLQTKVGGLGSTLDLHAVDQRLNNIEARLPTAPPAPAAAGGTKP